VSDQVELTIPARPEYLALVRHAVTTIASRAFDLGEVRTDDLRLAVSEACANAIDAYADLERPDARVKLRFTVAHDRVEVEVLDEAGGFDPTSLRPHPPVTKPARLRFERGLGIPLMRALADEVEFRAERGGTSVRLVVFAGQIS
jgi:serine/threonine-protein kinase RsbW